MRYLWGENKIIDTSIWDGKKILDTFIYDEEGSETSLHEYVLIDPLKNMIYKSVLGTNELSLVILGITKLCL